MSLRSLSIYVAWSIYVLSIYALVEYIWCVESVIFIHVAGVYDILETPLNNTCCCLLPEMLRIEAAYMVHFGRVLRRLSAWSVCCTSPF